MRLTAKLVLISSVLGLVSLSAVAGPILASCAADFSRCAIPENTLLSLPFLAISGDAIVLEPTGVTASDVFRIFNDVFDSGGGTGLGEMVFLFSSDDGALPNPSTYSFNAITIRENTNGVAQFNGNGTVYTLNTPEPSTFALFVAGMIVMRLLRNRRGCAVNKTLRAFPYLNRAGVVLGTALLGCITGWSQYQTIDLDDGTSVNVKISLDKRIGFGPQQAAPGDSITAAGLAFYSANYTSFGKANRFNIVGTDPSLGANTTIIPTVIVPIKVVFNRQGNFTLDGTNVVPAVQNSPIFQTTDYTTGGTDIGVTQFGDAIQRAQFWNLPGFSTNYHVLLGTPIIAPAVTVNVTQAGQGTVYALRSGAFLGVLDPNFFDPILTTLKSQYSANQLPIFLTDNVFEGTGGLIQNCCIIGYHSSTSGAVATAQTWIYSAYTEPGVFGGSALLDVTALSHEVAEWLNDPFVAAFPGINLIPPAVLPGQGGACIVNFETGDPLEAGPTQFTQITNSTTYHLQDEAFLWWYMHSTPSPGVNGFYSYLGTFLAPSQLCGPG